MPTRYSPVRHCRSCPRPCDLHVLSMPPAFALSQDQTLRFIQAKTLSGSSQNEQTQAHRFFIPQPKPPWSPKPHKSQRQETSSKAYCNASKRHANKTPQTTNRSSPGQTQTQQSAANPPPRSRRKTPRTPPTYPFLAYAVVKERFVAEARGRTGGPARERPFRRRPQVCQRASRHVPPRRKLAQHAVPDRIFRMQTAAVTAEDAQRGARQASHATKA